MLRSSPLALRPLPFAICSSPFALRYLPFALRPLLFTLRHLPFALCPSLFAICPLSNTHIPFPQTPLPGEVARVAPSLTPRYYHDPTAPNIGNLNYSNDYPPTQNIGRPPM